MYNKERYVVHPLGWSGYTANIYPAVIKDGDICVHVHILDEEGTKSIDVDFPECRFSNNKGFPQEDLEDIKDTILYYAGTVFSTAWDFREEGVEV